MRYTLQALTEEWLPVQYVEAEDDDAAELEAASVLEAMAGGAYWRAVVTAPGVVSVHYDEWSEYADRE